MLRRSGGTRARGARLAGDPAVEVDVRLQGGAAGRAAVPSGTSTGTREALEVRDQDPKRYGGKGVRTVVANVGGPLAAAVLGLDAGDQQAVERALIAADGTADKSRFGANGILGVSMAAALAAASARNLPLYRHLATGRIDSLPVPMTNVLNGGAHAANALDFQEFMIVPVGAPSMAEALRMLAETFHALRTILKDAGHVTSVGDEGGYAPDVRRPEDALTLLVEAIDRAGYRPGPDVALALDPAASSSIGAIGPVRQERAAVPHERRHDRLARAPGRSVPHCLGSKTVWRRTTGRVGGC